MQRLQHSKRSRRAFCPHSSSWWLPLWQGLKKPCLPTAKQSASLYRPYSSYSPL